MLKEVSLDWVSAIAAGLKAIFLNFLQLRSAPEGFGQDILEYHLFS